MGILLERMREKKILVSDGAWGTMLQARGLSAGQCPELWNVTRPEEVRAIAAAYARAGSDMVLTNTFGGSRLSLKNYGLQDRVGELNQAGARLSLEGAPSAVVAASIGPTGELLSPLGSVTEQELEEVFAEQIGAILKAGVRVLCVETMSAVEEAACAVRAAKALDGEVEVIATMTFSPSAKGFRTMMGVDPARAAEVLARCGADVLGANCGNGMAQMVPIVREFRRWTEKPLLVHANAGLPELEEGRPVYKETPAWMARFVPELIEAGARIIGGCCGTTAEHITAIREAVDKLR